MGNRGVLTGLADLIWPPRSLLSDRLVDRPGAIEAERWTTLGFLGPPRCDRCAFPFDQPAGDGAVCGACAASPPAYDKARAALAYDDASRRLVLELKRAGRRDGLAVFAGWMAQAGADVLTEAQVLVPVPLHWSRLAGRGYNQALWLAQALGPHTSARLERAALTRVKRRRSQAGLTPQGRRANVAGAIQPTPGREKALAGRIVLVVDDVFTTGATLEACARACRRAGAVGVHALTLARVVRPLDVLI